MSVKNISSAILGVGVDDTTIDLFESQYPVPTGVSYNSYVIRDEKIAILDTVDARATDEWMANVTEALAGEKPAYLVVHHMEPDHGANVARLAALYPDAGGGQRQDLSVYGAVLRPGGRRQGAPRRREGRREPFAGRSHPDFRVRTHGPLARGHGEL